MLIKIKRKWFRSKLLSNSTFDADSILKMNIGMQKRLDNKSSDSSLLHNQLNSEPEDVFNPFDNEVFSNENFDGNDLSRFKLYSYYY